MFRNRFLILLGGCALAASAALADDIGFIDCSKNADGAQVFAKPRRSPEVVASLPCGERFTILVYGFVFSRIQTSDGKVGFVYSNVIAVDRSGASVQQTSSPRMVTASDKVAIRTAPTAQPAPPPTQAQPQPTPAQAAPAEVAQVAPAQAPAPLAPAPITAEASASVAQPALPTPAQPQAAPPAPASTPAAEPTAPASVAPASNVPEPAASAAQPEPSVSAQPEPAPARPVAPAIRPAETRSTWERRNPGGVRRTPLIELFGGYAFARLDGGGGPATNMNVGGMGSVAWNFKPWLQLVADSSYSVVTISGVKNVLYGNHFGPRYFHHSRNRWGATPFVEALAGGSRADTTVPGVGGYTTSTNCISYKVGGGLDLHPSRHWEIRLFDVDYYRTAFGTNVHQNNYWASAGIVLRLFGGSSDY
jgi:hypothetical protein